MRFYSVLKKDFLRETQVLAAGLLGEGVHFAAKVPALTMGPAWHVMAGEGSFSFPFKLSDWGNPTLDLE